jgi:WD40 repeat protein
MPINWALLDHDASELVTVSGIEDDRNVLIGIWSTKSKQMLRHFLFRKSAVDEMPTGAVLADEGRQLVLTTDLKVGSNVYVFDIQAPEKGADLTQNAAPKLEKGIGDEDSIEPMATYSWPSKRHFGVLPSTDPNHILFMFRQARVERLNLLSGKLEMLHDRKMLELVLESSKVTASATIGKVQLLTTESGHLAWIDESQLDADMADDKAESVKIHDKGLTAVDVSPNESHVVVGTVDGQLILIDANTREKQQAFPVSEDPVTAVCWANSDQICTGDASGKLIFWQLKSGELKRIATLLDRAEAVRKILVSENGREIFVLMEEVYGLIRFDLAEFSVKLTEFSLAIE